MIDLYALTSPNVQKVFLMLEETALPYTTIPVDVWKAEQFKPEFLKINPNAKVPTIVDHDGPNGRPYTVIESGAILIYLAEKTGQFWPSDPVARMAALEWLMFQVGGFGPMPGQVHHFIALQDPADKRYGLDRFMAETRRLYGVMDRRLAGHEYFAGPLTIADFAIVGWVWRHARHQVDLADFSNVERWYQMMMARPGVGRGFAVAMRRA